MQRQGQDLLLNPSEVQAAKSINSFNFHLDDHPNGWHKVLRCASDRQADYWTEVIMQRVAAEEADVETAGQNSSLSRVGG